MKFRFIGDIHGDQDTHLKLIGEADYSLQVGDLGFSYSYLIQERVNSKKHKFIGGNHENYNIYHDSPHSLNDFGLWCPHVGLEIFYLRGGFSIDYKQRVIGVSWFENEELSYEEGGLAFQMYDAFRPNIVASHEPPFEIVDYLSNEHVTKAFGFKNKNIVTKTNSLLQVMRDIHKPKLHVFGHFHKKFDKTIDGTRFVCLPINGTLDINIKD